YILLCIALVSCNSKTEEAQEEEDIIVFSHNGVNIYEKDIYEVINFFLENKKETDSLDGYSRKGKLLTVSSIINDLPALDYIYSTFAKNDSLFTHLKGIFL